MRTVENGAPIAKDLVVVGKIGAPFGVHGWQHIQSYTDPIENLGQYLTWFIGRDNDWTPYTLAQSRRHQKSLVAQLQGIEDRDKAGLLTNALIAVKRAEFSPLEAGEYYWADLEGFSVYNQNEILGTIDYFYQNAGLDVMVVRLDKSERHIPFVMGDTVVQVQMEDKRIDVNWDFSL